MVGDTNKRKADTEQNQHIKTKKGDDLLSDDEMWKSIANGDLYIYNQQPNIVGRTKIAAFDIDGTIITTKSGNTFARDEFDWRILYAEIPGRIRQLADDNFKIVFFTNQLGIRKGAVQLSAFKRKIKSICTKLPATIQVFVSVGNLIYRKPCIGMWQHLEQHENDGIAIDKQLSFYVGDAAGRPAIGNRKKDHSSADRNFAANLGIAFHTPEEFFLGYKVQPFIPMTFQPMQIDTDRPLFDPPDTVMPSASTELIVLVGYPGSGKSTFARKLQRDYGYGCVNRDTLKTWQKCVSMAAEMIGKGQSVVVDNTNPDVESRQRYINLAKQHKISCRCFVMAADFDQSLHNAKYRRLIGADHEDVNAMILHMYKKKFIEPTRIEGYDQIVRVNFVADFGDNEAHRNMYRMFLVDK